MLARKTKRSALADVPLPSDATLIAMAYKEKGGTGAPMSKGEAFRGVRLWAQPDCTCIAHIPRVGKLCDRGPKDPPRGMGLDLCGLR